MLEAEGESKNFHRNDKHQISSEIDFHSNENIKRNKGFRNNNFNRQSFKRHGSNTHEYGKRKKMEVGNRLKECDVGITEFIGEHGFFGVIKERYTDFHVNEIALDGQIAKLTNQDIPCEVEENDNFDDLKEVIPDTIWEQLQTLKDKDSPPIEINVTHIDKDQRRAIHMIAKRITNVRSQTMDKEDQKVIVIAQNNKKNTENRHNFRKDNRVDWRKRGGEYCNFVLHKVNMDTIDVLNQLAMNLHIKSNNFSYAGTKDRRAWTTQCVSLKKVNPSDILRAAKCVHGAYVGNFEFVKSPLKLGMLSGNYFRIALRNVVGTDEQIKKAMTSLQNNGFVNYYGLQRFGTVAAIPTYEIGKALLQGKWNEAIELILKPREGEQDRDLAEARKIYQTSKDAYAAYKRIKRPDKIEAILLKGLYTSGSNNPQGALDSVPRNIRLMYIHAYQSFVWNQIVSRRIKEFGKKPVIGDLVYEHATKQQDNDTTDLFFENDNEIIIKEGGSNIENVTDSHSEVNKFESKAEVNNISAVKILTEKDLQDYTLADIIMPQVGWKVTYPTYAKSWFDEFLAKDGLNTDLRQKNKKYSLGGTYRNILQIPTNLSWKTRHYKEKHSDLIMCDIDEMRKLSPPKDEPDGQYKGVIITMSLKSSTYATMALREILKLDTSAQTQAAQAAACETKMRNLETFTNSRNQDVSEDIYSMQIDKNICN